MLTLSAPVSELAVTLPINPLTTSAAEPARVSVVLLASVVASTLSVTPLESVCWSPAPRRHIHKAGIGSIGTQRNGAAPGSRKVSILAAFTKLASVSVAAAVMAMVSLPAPPAIVAAAPILTAELKLKVSLPLPPVSTSAPPPPVIVLVPLPTIIVLTPAPPVTVRLPA